MDLEALTDAAVLFIPADRIRSCDGPEVRQMTLNLLGEMAAKMQTLSFKTRLLKEIKIRERLMLYLKSLPRDGQGYVQIPFTQADLAEYLGVSRSALSHEIKIMRDASLLEGDKKRIRLSADR